MTVFISHSFKDQPEFENVAEWLDQVGVEYFKPAEIKSASSLRDQLRSAIARCSVCIFVATRRSVESSWCGAELGAFWGAGIPIIVYLAEPSLPEVSLSPIVQGDVWERKLSRLAGRAKELTAAGRALVGDDAAPVTARVSSITVGQLELLMARAVSSTRSDEGQQPEVRIRAMRLESASLPGRTFPRTPEERAQLIAEQPNKWEYMLWAAILWEGEAQLEAKWQNHRTRASAPSAMVLSYENIGSFPTDVLNTLQELIRRINALFSPEVKERALGAPGEIGDPVEIERMAKGLLDIYEEMMDWAARVRGGQISGKYVMLAEVAAQIVDRPLELVRKFIDDFAEGMTKVVDGESLEISLTLTLDLDNEVLDAFLKEYERVM